MSVYEYYCDTCEREVQLTLSIREHDQGQKGPFEFAHVESTILDRGP